MAKCVEPAAKTWAVQRLGLSCAGLGKPFGCASQLQLPLPDSAGELLGSTIGVAIQTQYSDCLPRQQHEGIDPSHFPCNQNVLIIMCVAALASCAWRQVL